MSVFCRSELAINCWNIYGLFENRDGHKYNKLDSPELASHMAQYKLFGLVETHHISDDISKLAIVGFKCFQMCRKKLNRPGVERVAVFVSTYTILSPQV